jgi:4-alpha-glucanotransferase
MLRLDHIMQFHRLFWIPDGASAQQGTFVRYRMNEFYAILCLEARRHNVDLIGENLGTVPTEVNRKMAEHHLKKMFVVQYEIDSQDQITHYKVPRHSIASLNTHDMPTFFGYCLGNDLKRRIRHGLLTRREALEVYHGRKKTLQSLADFLYSDGYMEEQPLRVYILLKACLTFLARSRCRYLLVNFEDLWGETQQQNVPGTWDEHPNWRNKLRYSLEELDELANFKYILSLINNNRHKRNSNHDAAAEGSRQTTRAS